MGESVSASALWNGSLSSPETWPSGPVIQTARGRTRKQFGEVWAVPRLSSCATRWRHLSGGVTVWSHYRQKTDACSFSQNQNISPQADTTANKPRRQRDVWLRWGKLSQRDQCNSNQKTITFPTLCLLSFINESFLLNHLQLRLPGIRRIECWEISSVSTNIATAIIRVYNGWEFWKSYMGKLQEKNSCWY